MLGEFEDEKEGYVHPALSSSFPSPKQRCHLGAIVQLLFSCARRQPSRLLGTSRLTGASCLLSCLRRNRLAAHFKHPADFCIQRCSADPHMPSHRARRPCLRKVSMHKMQQAFFHVWVVGIHASANWMCNEAFALTLGSRQVYRRRTCFPYRACHELPPQFPNAVVVRNTAAKIHDNSACAVFDMFIDLQQSGHHGQHTTNHILRCTVTSQFMPLTWGYSTVPCTCTAFQSTCTVVLEV